MLLPAQAGTAEGRAEVTARQDRSRLRKHPHEITAPLPLEEWRSVSGFVGYFVSNLGRVCSVDRTVNDKLCRGRVLRPGRKASGHVTVSLGRGNSVQVHTLVLLVFVGPCPEGNEGLHSDDNPLNNTLTNLRYGTRSDNLHDAVRNGKRQLGMQIKHSKLTDENVRFIRENPGSSMNSLAKIIGVSCAAVKQVRDGITWKHVA